MGLFMDKTLSYYNENAKDFAVQTQTLDFSDTAERFLALLPSDSHILDFGCGAGRDTKYFLDHGFRVTAVDGSKELCVSASAYTGIQVKQMLFQDLSEFEKYEGIWACASVLHLEMTDLKIVFVKMLRALKLNGILYVSFKYGTFEGYRNGRWFIDFTEEKFEGFRQQFPQITIENEWVSRDVRQGREAEKWLNLLIRKTALL